MCEEVKQWRLYCETYHLTSNSHESAEAFQGRYQSVESSDALIINLIRLLSVTVTELLSLLKACYISWVPSHGCCCT